MVKVKGEVDDSTTASAVNQNHDQLEMSSEEAIQNKLKFDTIHALGYFILC